MKCSRCGFPSTAYTISNSCSICGSTAGTGTSSASTQTEIAPWETASAGQNPLNALTATFYNSFFASRRFFSKTNEHPSLMPALIYGMLLGTIGTCATALYSNFPTLSILLSNSGILDDFNTTVTPGTLIATPLILLVQLFFSTLFFHTLLVVTGSRKKPFLYTFKTMCYAEGAMMFQVLPLIGAPLAVFAWMYLTVVGIRSTHDISTKRTILALLFPVLLLIGMLVMITAMVVLALGLFSGSPSDLFSLFKQR